MCLLLGFVLILGVGVFTYRYIAHGDDWASYEGNLDVYARGDLSKGSLYDTNGQILMKNTSSGMEFNENADVRKALMHVPSFCIDKFASVCTMKNSLIFFQNERFDMFRHFISHYRELYSNEKIRNRQFRHILEYPVGNSHFFVSFVTSNNFPYASNDLREASEIVIISDSMEAVKVITIIII